MSRNKNNNRKIRFFKGIIWIIGIWIGSVAILEAVLSTSMLTNTVNRCAAKFIDGNISFGKVSGSLFSYFPSLTVSLEDFCITYPSDRFASEDLGNAQNELMTRGQGNGADTLAYFETFATSIRITPLLFGKLNVPFVGLRNPKIYAHKYSDNRANWEIFRFGESQKESSDSSEFIMPEVNIGRVLLTDYPYIIYTDCKDTTFAMIELKQIERTDTEITLDSMFVAGRLAGDTLALGLDRLRLHEHDGHVAVSMQAKTHLATRAFGRMNVPIDMSGTLHFPEDSVLAIGLHDFKAEVAAVPMSGEADLRFHTDRVEIDGQMAITECKVNDILHEFVCNFIPEAAKVETDAVIGAEATINGDYIYETGKLPMFRLDLMVPESKISHSDLGEEVMLMVDASLANTRKGAMNVNINDIKVNTKGLHLSGYGAASDILSDDPSFTVDGSISAILDSLMRFVPDSLDLTAQGTLAAQIGGSASLSHMNMYTFSQSDLSGKLSSEGIVVKYPKDSLDAQISGLEITLGPESVASRRDSTRTMRRIGVHGKIDRIDASYHGSVSVEGKAISLTARSSASGRDTAAVKRLGGEIGAESLAVKDASGTSISLKNTVNSFQMSPKRGSPRIPVLTLTSENDRITLMTDVNRAILTDAGFEARATMNTLEERQVRTRGERRARQQRELPEWMREEDFRKQDIDIRLDQSIAKYVREWDMHGDIRVRTGIIMTPYFPLRNILRGMEICFTNDRVAIDSLKVMSGKSTIEAKGELTGLKRALTARGRSSAPLKLDIDLKTDGMDANEILTAYNTGSHFKPDSLKGNLAEASDAEFLKMVVSDTAAKKEEMKLIVVPGNVNADISIEGRNISYSDLSISSFDAKMLMRERCVQITNTMATSNIGDISLEGFYATRSKQDIKAGFNFDFKDITAEKAIALMPAVDTVMPLLKSFSGLLNCELAATASLDTNMNILTPTINGVMRISGDSLTISNSEMFTTLAKKLKFDNRSSGTIQHMTVEGVIKDNVLEVFPFVVNLDRYTLALSGKQNLDMSYRYHASLIKSPVIIRVGVDVYGQDFDHMKFKIGKPKYKNDKIPVFTAVIDETKINLAQSIRGIFEKGVEAAVRENERQDAIIAHRREIGYVNAVDQETEELSKDEQSALDDNTENNK